MRPLVVLGTATAVVGAVALLTRTPPARRFLATVREAAGRREAELRRAVEVAVTADATARAPRHAPDPRIPDLDVDAGWEPRGGTPGAPREPDPARSLSPEEARELLLDPTRAGDADRRAR